MFSRLEQFTVRKAVVCIAGRVVGLESWTWTQVGLESDFLRTSTGLGLEGQGLGLGLGLGLER